MLLGTPCHQGLCLSHCKSPTLRTLPGTQDMPIARLSMIVEGWKEDIDCDGRTRKYQAYNELALAPPMGDTSRAEKVTWNREGVSRCLKGQLHFWFVDLKILRVFIIETYCNLQKLPSAAQINKQCSNSQVTPWCDGPSASGEICLFGIRQRVVLGFWELGTCSSSALPLKIAAPPMN